MKMESLDMSKPFLRYEDVPLLMASEGQDPVLVFANNATLSASQSLKCLSNSLMTTIFLLRYKPAT